MWKRVFSFLKFWEAHRKEHKARNSDFICEITFPGLESWKEHLRKVNDVRDLAHALSSDQFTLFYSDSLTQILLLPLSICMFSHVFRQKVTFTKITRLGFISQVRNYQISHRVRIKWTFTLRLRYYVDKSEYFLIS